MSQILKTLLYEWQDRKLPPVISRDVQLDTSIQSTVTNATVITGFRRVGKTYMLYEAINKLLTTHSRHEVVYINFEDERILTPSTDLLTGLVPEIQAIYGHKPKYLFLDELQLVPGWSKWIRRILDTESIQIFVTGSSSKMGSAQLPTELRGRAWEIKAQPLSFPEFLRFKQISLDFTKTAVVRDEMSRFQFLFNEYLLFGGLPAVTLTSPEKKQELLQSYFQTVVQKDITERHKINNDLALKTLLKILLNSSYITISKLHNTLKGLGIPVGKSTVDNYLSYIEDSYFMNQLYLRHPAITNQLQHPRKVYFIDNGFMTALSTKFSKNMGRLLENAVFRQLIKKHETIHYYQDNQGGEVDFATLSNDQASTLYQVCFDLTDENTQTREIKSLLKAGSALNCQNLNLLTLEKPNNLELPSKIKLVLASDFFSRS